MGSPEPDGIMVFSPAGEAIGRIALPERCASLCFGGAKRNRLFMAACRSLYAVYVNTRGTVRRQAKNQRLPVENQPPRQPGHQGFLKTIGRLRLRSNGWSQVFIRPWRLGG